MGLTVNQGAVQKQLEHALDSFGRGPFLFHFDLGRVGFLESARTRNESLQGYLDLLLAALAGRTMIVPTFHYTNFGKSRRYDVENDASEVGVLNEYIRKIPYPRTRTPIFSFCLVNAGMFSFECPGNLFGRDSNFGELYAQNGSVVFFGPDLSCNTFIHFMEEECGIGYRYLKRFTGATVASGAEAPVMFEYRVRPLEAGMVDYDWEKITADAEKDAILFRYPLGLGTMLVFRAADACAYWKQRIVRDELYLLTRQSRDAVESAGKEKGYPFSFEAFEA